MTKRYYHFTNDRLRDGSPIPEIGKWLIHKGEIKPCESGLHASANPFDAIQYAKGNILHLVELGGSIIPHGNPVDKVAARRRKIIATINAEAVMQAFARRCALDVLPLWKNAPAIVKRYLKTGDESIRAAVRAAAQEAAAQAAVRAAAWAAAQEDAAWAAAWAAVRAAAWAAAQEDAAQAAAWAAAWAAAQEDAARAANIKKYKKWFKEMVDEEFKKGSK